MLRQDDEATYLGNPAHHTNPIVILLSRIVLVNKLKSGDQEKLN